MLDLRLLPDSKSGAGASSGSTLPPVMEIKLAAAFNAGLFANRQYANECQ